MDRVPRRVVRKAQKHIISQSAYRLQALSQACSTSMLNYKMQGLSKRTLPVCRHPACLQPPSTRKQCTNAASAGSRRHLTSRQAQKLEATETLSFDRELLQAHDRAVELFEVIESKDFLQPGESEEDINKKIFELTAARFGTRKHWHKRLVRTGENTIHPIHEDTPDRELQDDDIAFIDLGPVFGNLEADFARTYVIGGDQAKHDLAAALPQIFTVCKEFYQSCPDMTGAQLYAFVCKTCKEFGYVYGNGYCAHLLGEFAHKTRYGLEDINFARPENDTPMSDPAPSGEKRYWVLEIHILQDPAIGTYGGFYEDLLNL